MDLGSTIRATFDSFERLLRWVYPGLLFWALLPLAVFPVDKPQGLAPFASFYSGVTDLGHIGIVVASGFLIYLVERYIVHEAILWVLFHFFDMGTASNNRNPDGNGPRSYLGATGATLWRRFGLRPFDGNEAGDKVEDRFDRYLVSRNAAVHAMGSTVMVFLFLWALGTFVFGDTWINSWGLVAHIWFSVAVGFGVVFWVFQIAILARADQDHYK